MAKYRINIYHYGAVAKQFNFDSKKEAAKVFAEYDDYGSYPLLYIDGKPCKNLIQARKALNVKEVIDIVYANDITRQQPRVRQKK